MKEITSLKELIDLSQTLTFSYEDACEGIEQPNSEIQIGIPTKVWEEVLEKNNEKVAWKYATVIDKDWESTVKVPCAPEEAQVYMGCVKNGTELRPYKWALICKWESEETNLKPIWITPIVKCMDDIRETIPVRVEIMWETYFE